MNNVNIYNEAGDFAENKDTAKKIRITKIVPCVKNGKEIQLDFGGVELATQSFIHALLSEVIRTEGIDVLDLIIFKNCNQSIRTLVNVVCDYMQDSFE